MSPEQVQGLWICFVLSISMALICPAIVWILPHRTTV